MRHNYRTPWFLLYSLWINRQKLIKFSTYVMSGINYAYISNNNTKLLAQFVFKMSAFRFTCKKTRAPLPMTSRWRRHYAVKAISKVGKFSDIACSIISCLVVGILCRKQHGNKVLPSGSRGNGNYASPCILSLTICVWEQPKDTARRGRLTTSEI